MEEIIKQIRNLELSALRVRIEHAKNGCPECKKWCEKNLKEVEKKLRKIELKALNK
jgi:hypothetical protein